MRKNSVLIAFVVCCAAFGAHAQPLVVRVGPGQTYATISAAISSLQQPLQQNVLVEVTLTPNGYAESGMIVDASGIDMNGHTLEISGVQPVLTTYYFGDDLEFRVSGEDVTIIENVLADGVIARRVRQDGSAGPNEYLVKNHLGSTVAAISGDGQAVGDVVDYFSYGKKRVVQHSSGGSDPVTQSFTGKELDELGTGYSRIDLKIEFVETAMPQAPAINALTIAFTDGTSLVTSFEPLSGGATWTATSSKTFGFDKTIQSLRIQLETADPTVGTLDYTQSVNKAVREGEVIAIDYREHANDLSGCSGQNCIFVPDAVENALAMEETGLYYFGARYYDPEIGRWTSVDPMGQYFDVFQYGGNNPVNRIDPDGGADVAVAWNVSGSIGVTGSKGVNLNMNINSSLDYLASKTNNEFAKAWLNVAKLPFDALDWAANGFRAVPQQDAVSLSEVTGVGGGIIAGGSGGVSGSVSIGNPGDYSIALKGTLVAKLGGWAAAFLNFEKGHELLGIPVPVGGGIAGGPSIGLEGGIAVEKTTSTSIKK